MPELNTPAATTDTPRTEHSGSSSSMADWSSSEYRPASMITSTSVLDELRQHLPLVHAGAEPADHALRPQLRQCRERAVQRLGVVLVGVVHVHDVDPVGPDPFEAGLQRPQHAVAAVVAHPPDRRGHVEALVVPVARTVRVGHQQPAHLRGQDDLVPRPLGQYRAQPPFGQAEPVVRCRVEVPDTRGERRPDGGLGVCVASERYRLPMPAAPNASGPTARPARPSGRTGCSAKRTTSS